MRHSKNTLEYWRGRLQRRKFTRKDGDAYESADYFVAISIDGKQVRFSLDSGNKEVAADKALEIWHYLKANGAQATLEKYKPSKAPKKSNPTVGEFLQELQELRLHHPRTFANYSTKLRTLVVGIMKLPKPRFRYDYINGGYEQWLKRVHSIRLSQITPAKIMKWRARYIDAAAPNPISRRSAQVTAASTIRNAKALFKSECLRHLPFELQSNPFEGVTAGNATTRRYKSCVDFAQLAKDAKDELFSCPIPQVNKKDPKGNKYARREALSKREQFKILILGLGAGLRRGEIDLLQWSQVDFEQHQITVEESQYGSVKSESSERVVDIDESLTALLSEFKKRSDGKFVISSPVAPRPNATYRHYRCNRHFDKLLVWLRSKGINKNNALHQLRKEYGSKVCDAFGIHAASEALGHKSIAITQASYLEKKGRKVVSIF